MNYNDFFTPQEIAEMESEAKRLAQENIKKEMREKFLKERVAAYTSEFKADIISTPTPTPTTVVASPTEMPISDSEVKNLNEEIKILKEQVDSYKEFLSKSGYKLNNETNKVESSKVRSVLERLGVEEEDIINILKEVSGDEEYDEIKELASKYFENKALDSQVVIEDGNSILDFSANKTSF